MAFRRLVLYFLIFCMVLSLVRPAIAAEDNTAGAAFTRTVPWIASVLTGVGAAGLGTALKLNPWAQVTLITLASTLGFVGTAELFNKYLGTHITGDEIKAQVINNLSFGAGAALAAGLGGGLLPVMVTGLVAVALVNLWMKSRKPATVSDENSVTLLSETSAPVEGKALAREN